MQTVLRKHDNRAGQTCAPIQSTRLILDNNYADSAIELIKDATSEIRLCAYAWRWYGNEPELGIQKFNIEILRAIQRGVVVRCLVDTHDTCVTMRAQGINARCTARNKMLHTKAICTDRRSLAIGSHNLTKRANCDNFEMSLITQEYEPIAQFIKCFDGLWANYGQS